MEIKRQFRGLKNPAQLFAFFEEYKQWAADNPLYTNEQKRGSITLKFDRGGDHEELKEDLKDAISNPIVSIPRRRPLYIGGFIAYMCNVYGLKGNISPIIYNLQNKYPKFKETVEYIKSVCDDDITEGAAVDGYNINIANRILDHSRTVQQMEVDKDPETANAGIVINFNTVTPLPLDEDADLDETAGADTDED